MIGELVASALVVGGCVLGVRYCLAMRICALDWQERYTRSVEDLFESRQANDILKEEKRSVEVELDDMKRIKVEREDNLETAGYAVTGTPRHVPWHIRKKELEAKSRTKRKQIEEFRSQA